MASVMGAAVFLIYGRCGAMRNFKRQTDLTIRERFWYFCNSD